MKITCRRLALAALLGVLDLDGLPLAQAAETASTYVAGQSKKPNIVFILADNIGWGDFGVYGGTTATPRIDALANSGIRFNNYNVEGFSRNGGTRSASACAP